MSYTNLLLDLQKEADTLDKKDLLKSFRKRFHYPSLKGKHTIYFCGNSLGLMPKGIEKAFVQECKDWATWGVGGHWKAKHAWINYHKPFSKLLAPLCGAKTSEVVAMNSLTVNLHLALASFYNPTKERYVILHETKAFSSDLYALESVVRLHGLDPKQCLLNIDALDVKTIVHAIKEEKNLALVLLGGVNYYSGEVLDFATIAKATHASGALIGFDLAHAIGNIPLKLHTWNIDFAVWCSYKYLNSGPGATGGMFVHQRHGENTSIARLAGWWGHQEKDRFAMNPNFKPSKGAEGWQLSNAPVFNMVAQRVSLKIFHEAGLKLLFSKQEKMSTFFFQCLLTLGKKQKKELRAYSFSIITPKDKKLHGCQLSLQIHEKKGKRLFEEIEDAGIVGDWREPDVIRFAPVPLYNTYLEIYRLAMFFCERAFLST